MFSTRDHLFLSTALELSKNGKAMVRPNPLVGAVVVKEGKVVAEGFHAAYGGPHAEAVALDKAGKKADGATLYCNFEPCSFSSSDKHNGPCTLKIIEAGVSRVVVGQIDPNRRVRGQGIEQLRKAGIEVEVAPDGPRLCETWYTNARFNTAHSLNRPYVSLKLAQSLDGRIATVTGNSKWITDEKAREEVHLLRAEHDGVLVGIGTVQADDPQLTVRVPISSPSSPVRQPWAVVLDTHAELPVRSSLVRNRADRLILYAAETSASGMIRDRIAALRAKTVTVRRVPAACSGKLSLPHVLDDLKELGLHSVLVEGGGEIATTFLKQNLFDALHVYIAPFLIGGDGKGIDSLGVESISGSLKLERVRTRAIGSQVLVSGFRKGWFKEIKDSLKENIHVYGSC